MAGYIGTSWKAASQNIAQERATNQAYFVSDTWKVRPGLTIDAGFRYELMPPYSYKNDTASNWQVPYYAYTPADAVGHPHPGLVRVGSGDVYGGSIPVRFDPAIPVGRDGRLGDRRRYFLWVGGGGAVVLRQHPQLLRPPESLGQCHSEQHHLGRPLLTEERQSVRHRGAAGVCHASRTDAGDL